MQIKEVVARVLVLRKVIYTSEGDACSSLKLMILEMCCYDRAYDAKQLENFLFD